MFKAISVFFVLASLCGCGPNLSLAVAQSSACRTNADTSGALVHEARGVYSIVDSAYLKSQGDPFAAPSDIELVTNSNTCESGVAAYNETNNLSGKPTALTSAYVIALGQSGYIVVDPANTTGEFTMMFIYDRNWQLKRAVAG